MSAGKEKTVVLYCLCGPGQAEAEAARLREAFPGLRLFLAAELSERPVWADYLLPHSGIGAALRGQGLRRPDLLVLVVANEPRFTRPAALLRALLASLSLRPRKRSAWLYAWSGRYSIAEKPGEVLKKGLEILSRPAYLTLIRLAYLAGEALFPLLNRKPRDGQYGPDRVKRVLFLSLDLIGDLVWAGPAISSVKRTHPDCVVHLAIHPRNSMLADLIDGVDLVITYEAPWLRKVHNPTGQPKAGRPRFWKNFWTRLFLFLGGYDLVVDFRGEAKGFVFAYFTGAPYRAGYACRSSGAVQPSDVAYLLTHMVDAGNEGVKASHLLERNMLVMNSLGFYAEVPGRWLKVDLDAKRSVAGLLQKIGGTKGGVLVGIQPGASRAEKRWGRDGFVEVAADLSAREGVRVALAGSPEEGPLGSYIAERAPGSLNLCGMTDLREFVMFVDACDIFICNETSAISIASACKTPVVCLMTGVPGLYGPYGVKHAVLQVKPECWSPVIEHCLCPHGYTCLREITAGDVLKAVDGLLPHKPYGP